MYALEYLINAHQRVFWLYLLSSVLIALVFVYFRPQYRGALYDKMIWWHPSARLDYLYFIIGTFIKGLLIAPLLFSASEVTLIVLKTMRELFGYQQPLSWSRGLIFTLYTLMLFLLSDLTRYGLHRAMHTVPFLWRLHRVHHSAEALNPLTFYRVHPLENLLFGLRYALSAGIVSGLFIYYFGARVGVVELLGGNALVVFFALAGSNLRHSHLPLRFGKLESIFISPYMHQLHHSKTYTHTNFGGVLSVWDAIFKTLTIIQTKELCFGLKHSPHHNSVRALLFEPFTKQKISQGTSTL